MKNNLFYVASLMVALSALTTLGCVSVSREHPVVASQTTTTTVPKSGAVPSQTTVERTTNY